MLWTAEKYADETCVETVRVPYFELCSILVEWTKQYMETGRFDSIHVYQEDKYPVGRWIYL